MRGGAVFSRIAMRTVIRSPIHSLIHSLNKYFLATTTWPRPQEYIYEQDRQAPNFLELMFWPKGWGGQNKCQTESEGCGYGVGHKAKSWPGSGVGAVPRRHGVFGRLGG